MPEGATFSSAQARSRDKIIEDKHRREVEVLERKIENLRRSNDDTRKQLFDTVHRADRLAQCLGYGNVFEAQEALDMMEPGFNYKQCVQRLQELENAAEHSKGEAELYAQQLGVAVSELKECQEKKTEQDHNYAILARDHDHLKELYASLELKFTRAADRYKLDYKKWRNFQLFLNGEDKKHRVLRNQDGVTSAEQDRLEAQFVKAKIAFLQNMGPNLQHYEGEDEDMPPPMGGTELPEHLATPQHRPFDMAHASSSRTLVGSDTQRPVDRIKRQYAMPSSSPTLFSARSHAVIGDELDAVASSDTEPESHFSPSHPPSQANAPEFKHPGLPLPKIKHGPGSSTNATISIQDEVDAAVSSDTEPESHFSPSQPVGQVDPPAFKLPGLPMSKNLHPAASNSSDTEEESQFTPSPDAVQTPERNRTELRSVVPTLAFNPVYKSRETVLPPVEPSDAEEESRFTPKQPQSKPFDTDVAKSSDTEDDSQDFEPFLRHQEVLTPSISANLHRRPADGKINSERPSKIRRVSGIEFIGNDASTPLHNENLHPRRVPQTEPAKTVKAKHLTQPWTQSDRGAGKSTLSDYSIFKGKGRYSKKAEAGPSTSINSKYVINPAKNAGLDYQYDEVVRGRDDRKKMNAGDCECCRDYYQAVGPLPSRLQPPLWRSPSTTPKKACQHPRASEESPSSSRRQQDINKHKKAISRHRFNWERAKTPPDYWNIGFPSTQEVGDINKRAERMHQQKVHDIEKEAASGMGKYRRK